jgi:hypothetical protein
MARVTEKVRIPMDPDLLWENIGGFGAVGIWHPMLAKVEVQREELGAVRTAHGRDGTTYVERLVDVEPEQHRYRYKMESTPLPVGNYVGEFRIESDDEHESSVVWAADFDVTKGDEATTVGEVRQFLRSGLDQLRAAYGGSRGNRVMVSIP